MLPLLQLTANAERSLRREITRNYGKPAPAGYGHKCTFTAQRRGTNVGKRTRPCVPARGCVVAFWGALGCFWGVPIAALRSPPPSAAPSCPPLPAQQSRRAGRPRCGKQVLSCQSGARLEQEPTGLNRRERIPSQPLIYIQYTLHPPRSLSQLRAPPAQGGREGGAPLDPSAENPLPGTLPGTRGQT